MVRLAPASPALQLSRAHAAPSLSRHARANLSPGVKSHEVSLENQTAIIVAAPELSYETVLATISKTGKKVNAGFADGEEKSVAVPAAA